MEMLPPTKISLLQAVVQLCQLTREPFLQIFQDKDTVQVYGLQCIRQTTLMQIQTSMNGQSFSICLILTKFKVPPSSDHNHNFWFHQYKHQYEY